MASKPYGRILIEVIEPNFETNYYEIPCYSYDKWLSRFYYEYEHYTKLKERKEIVDFVVTATRSKR